MSENKHNKYIELALRAKIAKVRPDFPSNFANKVVDASMANGNEGVSRPVLLQAIDLVVDEKDALTAENAKLRKALGWIAHYDTDPFHKHQWSWKDDVFSLIRFAQKDLTPVVGDHQDTGEEK